MSPEEFRLMGGEPEELLQDEPSTAPEGEPTPAETEVGGIIHGLMRISVPFDEIWALLSLGLSSGELAKIAALRLSGVPTRHAVAIQKQPGLCTALLRAIQASHPAGADPRC